MEHNAEESALISFSSIEIFFGSLVALGVVFIVWGLLHKPKKDSRPAHDPRWIDFCAPLEAMEEPPLFAEFEDKENPREGQQRSPSSELQEQKREDIEPVPVRKAAEGTASLQRIEQNHKARAHADEMTALDWWVAERLELPDRENSRSK